MSRKVAHDFGHAVQSQDRDKIVKLLSTDDSYREKNASAETVPRKDVPSLLLPPKRMEGWRAVSFAVNEDYGDFVLNFELVDPDGSKVADDELRLQIDNGVVCSIVA
jgi:hypothetical protein